MKHDFAKMRHRHENVLLWLVNNPGGTQRECATALGYTEAWLSMVINSDMFQHRLRAMRKMQADVAVAETQQLLVGAANKVLRKTNEMLSLPMVSEKFVADSQRGILGALGYLLDDKKGKPSEPERHVHVHLTAQELADARNRIGTRGASPAKLDSTRESEQLSLAADDLAFA